MLTLIILILGGSFILYTLLGGADFGAGIVETFIGKKEDLTISKAMAPVWEANHVWLILAVVILFTGFPSVYSSLSLVLHIPLMMVLVGIVMRGTAFTFRYYDVDAGRSRKYYTWLFHVSSFLTPIFLGMILGAMILGRITFDPKAGFYEVFMAPWLNLFCLLLGLFSAGLFTYLAAVFLAAETENESDRARYCSFSKKAMLVCLAIAVLIFIIASVEGYDLAGKFWKSAISRTIVLMVIILCIVIWFMLKKGNPNPLHLRVGVAAQISGILIGWFYAQLPVLVQVKKGESLTLYNAHAPDATLHQLLIALLIGLLLVIPGFAYLFRIFKAKSTQ
jgi:cytochrome bd ubiquinol oxidase subunit II